MRNEMTTILNIYKWPSQAFWRYFELRALKQLNYEHPILEIGCGDGQFSSLLFREIDDAIDINPRAVERCRKLAGGPYRRVRCLDARELELSDGGYGTIYANCVMEHIPDIKGVLAGCYRGLRDGGKLIMTVPLDTMNDYLQFPWRWYARVRQQQLVHVNLLNERDWKDLLLKVGFTSVEFRAYLSGEACRFWDSLDSPGCIGLGRYRVAPILGRMFLLAPAAFRNSTLSNLSKWLTGKATGKGENGPACAAVVIAQKAHSERLQ